MHVCRCKSKQVPAVWTNKPSPLITVGELHVHAVAAQEGLAVERRVYVGRVWDGLAHQHGAGERRLLDATQDSGRTPAVHLQVSGAVQHLQKEERLVTFSSWVSNFQYYTTRLISRVFEVRPKLYCTAACWSLNKWQPLTFQLADLRLTVRPRFVTVHFILMKKSRSVLSSLTFLLKPLPGNQSSRGRIRGTSWTRWCVFSGLVDEFNSSWHQKLMTLLDTSVL